MHNNACHYSPHATAGGCAALRPMAQAYGPGLWPRPMACSFWLAACMHYSACCYLPPAAAGGLAPRLVRLMDFALAGYAHALRCPCLRTRLPRVSSVCLDEHTYNQLNGRIANRCRRRLAGGCLQPKNNHRLFDVFYEVNTVFFVFFIYLINIYINKKTKKTSFCGVHVVANSVLKPRCART